MRPRPPTAVPMTASRLAVEAGSDTAASLLAGTTVTVMNALRIVATIGGFGVLAGTTSSVLRTLVVPRGVSSWLSEHVLDGVVRVSRLVADQVRDFERRDLLLAWAAPLSLMVLLLGWLAAYAAGFALLTYGFGGLSFVHALRQS